MAIFNFPVVLAPTATHLAQFCDKRGILMMMIRGISAEDEDQLRNCRNLSNVEVFVLAPNDPRMSGLLSILREKLGDEWQSGGELRWTARVPPTDVRT